MVRSSTAPSFERLKLISRSAAVREQLVEAVRRGDYRPGDKLPSERELAEMFGVSRVSIREAIRSLEAIGLVEVRHGAGTMVVDPAQRTTRDLTRWMEVNRGEVLDLLLVRAALDELAGEEAAARGDAEAIAAIRAAHAAFKAAVAGDEIGRLAALDMSFHLAVAEAAGSELLRNLLAELHGHLAESRAVFFSPEGRAAHSAKEHGAILAAIERGDRAGARRATKAHIASVRRVMAST